MLHKALADAVRVGTLPANPADRVALPRHDPRGDAPATVQAWTAAEERRFLDRTHDDPHHDLWATALGTGMRRGELLGLRWCDVALDDQLVTVTGSLTVVKGTPRRKATKTNRIRRLYIDGHTATALEGERRRLSVPSGASPRSCRPGLHRRRQRSAQPAAHDPPVPPSCSQARRRPDHPTA